MRCNKFICCVCFILLTVAALSQQMIVIDNNKLLEENKYREYLGYVSEADNTASFTEVVAIAISLERTAGWHGDIRQKIDKRLEISPEHTRYIESIHSLLQGDAQGVKLLFDGKAPNSNEFARASHLLHAHGFDLAADIFAVFNPDLPGKHILSLLRIPTEKRGPVIETLLKATKGPQNRTMLAQVALDMYLNPPPGVEFSRQECYALALTIGEGTQVVSFATAQKLAQAQKVPEATQLAIDLALRNPADLRTQHQATQFLQQLGKHDAVSTLYRQAMQNVQEPARRDMRYRYLEYLQRQKRQQDLVAFTTGPDLLLAGDTLVLNKQYQEAANKYTTVLTTDGASVEKRLAAWAGLLDADPTAALNTGEALFGELAKVNPDARPALVEWTGRQLWFAINREVPPKRGTFVMGYRLQYIPIHDTPNWANQCARLMDFLIKADTVACIRPDAQMSPTSLRYAAAMIYALAGRATDAHEILYRKVDFQIQPPPGGWKIFDGTPTPDADKPRTVTSPSAKETVQLTAQVLEDLSRCPTAKDCVPPFAAIIANDFAKRIEEAQDQREVVSLLKSLAAVVQYTVVALDPLPAALRTDQPAPAPREVNLASMVPIEAAVRKALACDLAAKEAMVLIKEGMQPAMLTASNPELLDRLLTLSTETITKYSAAWQRPVYAIDAAAQLTRALAARPVYDMQPYIQRLNKTFPKPQ